MDVNQGSYQDMRMLYSVLPFKSFPILRKFVSFIYEIKTLDHDCIYTTIPNGKMGLSIILQGDAYIRRGNIWEAIPRATIYGLTKQTQHIKLSRHFKEIAIGFNPAVLAMFVNDSMSQFSLGKTIDLCIVFDKADINRLVEKVCLAETDHGMLTAIESFLHRQLSPRKENAALFSAVHMITKEKMYNVNDVSTSINVSSTTLRNLFRDDVGISPKSLIRVARITDVLHLQVTSEENLTQLAYKVGYFDQAHFIHEFKEVLGITPKQYFKNKNLAFDFYNFGRWTGSSFET